MPPLVPAFRAALESVVILGARFLDQTLQADVPAYLVAMLVEREEGEEPGDPPVAVAERVDAEEIEDQGGDGHQRRRQALVERVAVDQAELLDGSRRLRHLHRTEADEWRSPFAELDDLVVDLLPLPRVPTPLLNRRVEPLEELGSDRQRLRLGVDTLQSPAVALDLLFRAVARAGVLQHERAQPVRRHGDPLDPVRRLDALDEGRLAQGGEDLGRLVEIEILPPLRLGDVGHQPDGAERQGEAAQIVSTEGRHVCTSPTIWGSSAADNFLRSRRNLRGRASPSKFRANFSRGSLPLREIPRKVQRGAFPREKFCGPSGGEARPLRFLRKISKGSLAL